MPSDPELHDDRRRAESFGTAAEAYDRYRPRYPRSMFDDLIADGGAAALDVGAGTGIASEQLMAVGALVLAVEPDVRMARLAAAKGIAVEVSTFEDWQPAGRTFDLVVFAQSFHWVKPRPALEKVAAILKPGGRLALVWNRIVPTSPTNDDLKDIYRDYLDEVARPSIETEDRTSAILEECGFTAEFRHFDEELHYDTRDWLDLVFTYSNHLALPPNSQSELRARLEQRIGAHGVVAKNDALAVVSTPRPPM